MLDDAAQAVAVGDDQDGVVMRQRRQDQPPRSESSPRSDFPQPPPCPKCGALTTLRTAKGGQTPGSQFWGCTRYPDCKGTIPV